MNTISNNAKKILRHFRDNNFQQLAYEYPATLEAMFPGDAEACEAALGELEGLGLVALGQKMPSHLPQKNRIRAAAITLEGQRYIEKGPLD